MVPAEAKLGFRVREYPMDWYYWRPTDIDHSAGGDFHGRSSLWKEYGARVPEDSNEK